MRPVDPDTGAADALVFAMYHPAAALRTPVIERESFDDIAQVPNALTAARERRAARARSVLVAPAATANPEAARAAPAPAPAHAAPSAPEAEPTPVAASTPAPDAATDQLTLF
jgi:hypothetical protein